MSARSDCWSERIRGRNPYFLECQSTDSSIHSRRSPTHTHAHQHEPSSQQALHRLVGAGHNQKGAARAEGKVAWRIAYKSAAAGGQQQQQLQSQPMQPPPYDQAIAGPSKPPRKVRIDPIDGCWHPIADSQCIPHKHKTQAGDGSVSPPRPVSAALLTAEVKLFQNATLRLFVWWCACGCGFG